jgi:hypothetical protein
LYFDVDLSNIDLMKILGAYSLSSALKRVLDVIWVILVIAAVVYVVASAIHLAVPDGDFRPIKLSAMLKKPAGIPVIQSPPNVDLGIVSAAVVFKAPSRSLILVDGLYWFLGIGLHLGVLFHLRRVLASLTAGETFTRANARRLRIIAFLSLARSFWDGARALWDHYYLNATVQFAWERIRWPMLELDGLFFALVLFVIAEAARVGATLEEERALTV